MSEHLAKAMRAGYYYQAIFIEYAIIEDRCLSALRYAGVKYTDNKGNDITLSQKLNKMRSNSVFDVPYVRQRITFQLLDDITEWKRERDRLIHALAKIPYDHESIKDIATKGQDLVRVLSNKVKSINNYHRKTN